VGDQLGTGSDGRGLVRAISMTNSTLQISRKSDWAKRGQLVVRFPMQDRH